MEQSPTVILPKLPRITRFAQHVRGEIAMMVRALLYIQVVWIVVTGLMIRGALPFFGGRTVAVFLFAALYGFPIAVAIFTYRSDLSLWRRVGIALVQIGLSSAYVIALLPAVQ